MLGKVKKQFCEGIIHDSISRSLPLRVLTTLKQLVELESENIRSLDNVLNKKEASIAAIIQIFSHLRNLYDSLSRLSNNEEIKTIIKDLQFSVPLPKEDEIHYLGMTARLMLSAIDRFNSILIDNDYFLEETYLELKRLKADNNSCMYKSDLSQKENELFHYISKKLVEPYYDAYFDKMKSHFFVGNSVQGIYYQCDFPLDNMKEYKDITKTLKKHETIQKEVESFKQNFKSEQGWLSDTLEERLESTTLKLTIYKELIHELNKPLPAGKDKIKKGNISDFFPNIKAIFLLRENLDEIEADLGIIESLLGKKKKELVSLQKIKKTSCSSGKRPEKYKRETVGAVRAENVNVIDPCDSVSLDLISSLHVSLLEEEQLSALALTDEFSEVDPKTYLESYSLPESSFLKSSPSQSEENIFSSKESEKEEEKPEVIQRKRNEILPLHQCYARQEKDDIRRFSSKAKKMVEDIFDESKKINYYDLVNFVENTLTGAVDSKTKSSSRKIKIAPGQTVFMHQRHGRDRKNFVPVETVKAVKIVLQSLGIAPEGAFSKLTLH